MLPIAAKGKYPHHDRSSLRPREDPVTQAAHEARPADQHRALLGKLPLADPVSLECLVGILRTADQGGSLVEFFWVDSQLTLFIKYKNFHFLLIV